MSRPTDSLPTWAADATYDAPGDDWDGDPTKVEPALAKIEQGWEPTEAPPAEYLNWWMHRAAAWAQYLEETTEERQIVVGAASFAPSYVNGTDDIKLENYEAPTWDATFGGLVVSVPSGIQGRHATVDLARILPARPCEVRLVSAKGAFFDEGFGRLRIRCRAGNTGNPSNSALTGNLIQIDGAGAPSVTAFNISAAVAAWTPYEPGDRIELEFYDVATDTGTGSTLLLTDVTIAVREV